MKKKIISNLILIMSAAAAGMAIGVWGTLKREIKRRIELNELSDKHLAHMLLLNQWLKARQEGKQAAEYFYKNRIKRIAIYGMGYVGERLYEELRDSDIEIKYVIDKNPEKICSYLSVVSPDEKLPEVDAVIVTPVFYFEEIKNSLKKKVKCPLISLEDILYEI